MEEKVKTDQREVLTRQKIYEKLRAANRFQSLFYSVLCVLMGAILALLIHACTRVKMPLAILGIASIVFVSLLFLYEGYELIKHLCRLRSGNFHVVEDRVVRISENEVRKKTFFESAVRGRPSMYKILIGGSGRTVEENVIYFRDAGRVVCSKTACRISNIDDMYYLVKYEGEKEVELMYSQREYRLEEEA